MIAGVIMVAVTQASDVMKVNGVAIVIVAVMMMTAVMVVTAPITTGVTPPEEHYVTSLYQNCSHLQR